MLMHEAKGMMVRDNAFYSGDMARPEVGDVRVSYAKSEPGAVSVIVSVVVGSRG